MSSGEDWTLSYALSGRVDHPMLADVDSPFGALVFGIALLALILPVRLMVQHQRGTLDWRQERPLLLSAPLMVASLVAVVAAGPVARSLAPPLMISGLGIALLYYAGQVQDVESARTLRRMAIVSVAAGPSYLLGLVLQRLVQ